ncbi:hypothetical protein D3C72_1076750 [compost metagenome]
MSHTFMDNEPVVIDPSTFVPAPATASSRDFFWSKHLSHQGVFQRHAPTDWKVSLDHMKAVAREKSSAVLLTNRRMFTESSQEDSGKPASVAASVAASLGPWRRSTTCVAFSDATD